MCIYGCTYCQSCIGIVITFFLCHYAGGSNQQASSCNTQPTRNCKRNSRYVPFTQDEWNALPGPVIWPNIDVGPGPSREEIDACVKERMRKMGFSSSDEEQ